MQVILSILYDPAKKDENHCSVIVYQISIILMIIFISYGMTEPGWIDQSFFEHSVKAMITEIGSGKIIPYIIISVDGQKIGQADSTDAMGVFGAFSSDKIELE